MNWFNFGKTIYKDKNIKEYKRLVVFLIRVFFNRANINGLISFFSETYIKKAILKKEPFFIEIATRKVLYKDSRVEDRCKIIKNHFNIIFNKIFCICLIYFFP